MDFVLKYVLPILVGGFIGLFTNYLAIKMLFRPYKEIRIFKIRLPFTPGIIPKEKSRIALSLSETISNEFLNKDILKRYLLDDGIKDKISAYVEDFLKTLKSDDVSFYEHLNEYLANNDLEECIRFLKKNITKAIINKFNEYQISEKISKSIIKRFLNNKDTFLSKALSLFISDKISEDIESSIKDKIDEYINTDGQIELESLFDSEIRKFLNNNLSDLSNKYNIDFENIKKHLIDIYEMLVEGCIEKVINFINFKQIVYERIESLDTKELEKLILGITKKELNAITWIGGLLGIVISFVNLFVQGF